jgi:AcrR family transcriptional regulator
MTAAPVNFAERVTPCGPPDGDSDVRHRRRGAALEQAIHEAVVAELTEIGYAGFTIESVAARAHTGKASIYRRWPTKQQLVVDSMCATFGETFDLLDGLQDSRVTTRDALLHLGRRMSTLICQVGEAFRAAACEISRDTDLAAAFEEQVSCPKRQAMVGLLERGVARGEVRPEAADELFAEILPSMITSRLIVQNRPVPDEYLERLVDDVIMPLLRPE